MLEDPIHSDVCWRDEYNVDEGDFYFCRVRLLVRTGGVTRFDYRSHFFVATASLFFEDGSSEVVYHAEWGSVQRAATACKRAARRAVRVRQGPRHV